MDSLQKNAKQIVLYTTGVKESPLYFCHVVF